MFPLKRSSRDKPSRKEERQVSNILRDINLNDGGTETKKWGREREPSHYADINVNYGEFTKPDYMPREVYVNQNRSINLIFVEDGGEMRLPKFQLPENYDNPWEYLKDIAYSGMKKLGLNQSEKHQERLKTELNFVKGNKLILIRPDNTTEQYLP